MPETTDHSSIAIVAGDVHRCELHGQCEGLSRRVFRAPEHRARLRVGAPGGVASLAALRRAVRSCPMNALTLVGIEPSDQPQPEEQ
jgi:ferredoxin